MNSKYSISRFATGTLAAVAALLSTTACHDDFGYQNEAGQRIAFKLTAAEAWHNGMAVNENAPTTRCTSVQELSGDGDTQLYLHTVVADNPVAEPALTSRGTPITSTDAFKEKYAQFSLSGIYSEGESLYDLAYETATGTPWNMSSGHQLLTPASGTLDVYGFAPTISYFNKLVGTDGSLTLNESDVPTLTYTVPTDVTKQVDLMTACASVSSQSQELAFKHALTAVQIKCGKDMLAGKITEVTISGIHGTGTLDLKTGTWNELDATTTGTASYIISQEIELPASTDEDVADKIHAPEGTQIIGKEGDNLTFLLLPQVLPEGATMTIEFTDAATSTERKLTGSIAGQTWEAGKIVTYSISPSSIHISAKIDFSKKGATAENPTGDVIPYSGVWYDATYTAKAAIVQGESEVTVEIPADKITFQYKFDDTDWADCEKDANGLLTIESQPAYATMRTGFDTTTEAGTKDTPFSLSDEKGETANCYLVDKAGYYKLELAYGNGDVRAGNTSALNYYPKHDDGRMPDDGKISGAADAVLCWQDSPDLIDSASVGLDENKKNLVFHIRKHTLAQGNALLAVRNSSKEILWSWHIWVTPYKTDFYDESKFYTSEPDAKYSYDLAIYNLGWCDSHKHNASRKFSLRAVVDMSAYGGEKETPVEIGTFTQDVFKGSDAGDNTYYQWGRKDPMLGGIYNDYTPTYSYNKKGNTSNIDKNEFTMENKQVFNQYNQDGDDYSFCKNPGDMVKPSGEASKGVTIGYGIKHPYMFITNSKEYIAPPKPNEPGYDPEIGSGYNPTTGAGYDPVTGNGFNFRNHWHIPYVVRKVDYLNETTHIMFNAWNSGATDAGRTYPIKQDSLMFNADPVTKSVYDPCPPKFQVPPIHALKAIYDIMSSKASYANNAWTITSDGGSITFPLTGVRNYALRPTEWKTVVLTGSGLDYEDFYQISMPAFRMLTFLSSATIVKKEEYNAYQVYIFLIDRNDRGKDPGTSNLKKQLTPSSNSYGLSVRPMHYVSGT